MDNSKNDKYYVEKIQGDLAFINNHMKDVDENALGANEILMDSMMFRLIQISENSRKLSEQYKADHSQIPWTAIYGLRNRLVHDYGHVDLSVVYSTLKNDIPELADLLRNV